MKNELKVFDSKNIAQNSVFKTGENLFIEASAGTGKTYTIQQIVARLIAEGIPLKKVLIVTYTDKATGELRDRIRSKLENVLEDNCLNKNSDNKKNLSKEERLLFEIALQEIDDANIFTIHSFCQKTLRESAYEAGKPFGLNNISEDAVEDLIKECIRNKWVKNNTFKDLLCVSKSAASLENSCIEKFTIALNAYKGESTKDTPQVVSIDNVELTTLGDITIDENIVEKLYDKKDFSALLEIKEISENYNILKKHLSETFDAVWHQSSKDVKKTNLSVGTFVEALKTWNASGESMLFKSNSFGNDVQSAQSQEVLFALRFFYNLCPYTKGLLSKIMPSTYKTYREQKFLRDETPNLFLEWQKYKENHRVQSYNDMILSVRNAVLSQNSSLCKKIQSEYRYAIIDEFQDTNQLQWDIFKEVFLKSETNNIIVVGDPKQSIYSFQGADLNVYNKATKEIGIQNGRSLNSNYRSTKNLIEACNKLFDADTNRFFSSPSVIFKDSIAPGNKLEPITIKNGKESPVKPFLISEEDIDSKNFAECAAEKIIEWCTIDKATKKSTLQIFDKNNPQTRRNVCFSDFAVLARTRSEMNDIESALNRAGIPYNRYKDKKLFFGHECAQWIAIFKAIDAHDFSSYDRRILNEVLVTDFFNVPLNEVENKCYDNPLIFERKCIAEWKNLASKRRFAALQERIYADTKIEERLTDLSKLQNLAKLHQIGNYAINYLYENACSINDLIRQLETLSKSYGNPDDEDDNLIAKDTDFDAVQVMTIHASKGLEFPIVIAVAGIKDLPQRSGPYLYHGNDESLHLGISKTAGEKRKQEELEEWKRLFYVAYTRASSILILPRYLYFKSKKEGVCTHFDFLLKSLDAFINDKNNSKYFDSMPNATLWDITKETTLKEHVRKNILYFKKNPSRDTISLKVQRTNISALKSKISELSIAQHSYSSLIGKHYNEITAIGDTNPDKNREGLHIEGIDEFPIPINTHLYKNNVANSEETIRYPKGNKLGNAIHSVFENADFTKFKNYVTLEDALKDSNLTESIELEFKRQALPIDLHKRWMHQTVYFVYNTLKAKLPEILGNKCIIEQNSIKTFSLSEIEANARKAEMQFHFNTNNTPDLNSICKGFMDLLFVTRDKYGNKKYSILDWKSDFLENGVYDFNSVKLKVDSEYAVQRVLYSYCLIQWLKLFYKEKQEDEIFNNHFGGIYYVFVRGCLENTSNGIYAQTWENFSALKTEYEKLKRLMQYKGT